MKRLLKRSVPFVLAVFILLTVGWYLLEYDREFTRDMLIRGARFFDGQGHASFAATLYDLAYDYTGKDEDVAIELAQQYKNDGNYTKAEYTLTNAIADGGTSGLYVALCRTFVEQDKLLDAVSMLDHIADPAIKAELEAMRPAAPAPDPGPGYYNQYISVSFNTEGVTLYTTTDGDYPSIADEPTTEPIVLSGGETTIYALSVGENGLVSPLTVLAYTVGGVIEPAVFTDPAIELAMREVLGAAEDETLMTDRLWEIKEFTIPAEAESLSDLCFLPFLEKLTIEDQKLDSLSILGSLSSLQELSLTGCRFDPEELRFIAGLPKLQKLTLSECGLSTIASLGGAQNLTVLDLSGNTLRNLEPLIPMITLQELYLQRNAVTSLDALANMQQLQKLDVSYNSLTSVLPLVQCTSLTWLNAGHNQISDVKGMEAFPGLTHLELNHNKLTDAKPLAQLNTLTELNLSNNSLLEIYDFKYLTNLVSLNVSYNDLTHFPIWERNVSPLSVLDASHNAISTVAPLANLQELTYLYLDYNRLTSLDAIADNYRLVMVNAYGNDIQNVSKLTNHNIIVNYDPT